MVMSNVIRARRLPRVATVVCLACAAVAAAACAGRIDTGRAQFATALRELNEGPCAPGQRYVQEDLREPTRILPEGREVRSELVVALRKRCVPVWVPTPDGSSGSWQMQTLTLRTYGFPRDPGRPITEADANDPNSPHIAWSAPGPTFVVHPASSPGAPDGTRIKIRLYNRMPWVDDDQACVPNEKCNTSVDDKGNPAGVDPKTGRCYVPPSVAFGGFPAQTPAQTVGGKTVEPPNCFHGLNSTNLHFHGFHVSPQPGQDDVGLEIRPPMPPHAKAGDQSHASHGPHAPVAYGHFDYDVDPLRYTQAPGTHWYHAHKHGSTGLQILNGQVGTFEVRGEFDQKLEDYFRTKGGGALVDRLLVVQQLAERQTGLAGADQSGAVLVNGQGNPRVRMKAGEIQRWRFVGATMQASAALRIGFPDIAGKEEPEVRQIAMDGVQFSPENYTCQPFLNNPDCTPAKDDGAFNELTAFKLSPGNRVDVLVKAPATPGVHCMSLEITTELAGNDRARQALVSRAATAEGTCGIDPNSGLGPLFTLVIDEDAKPMAFPARADFPPTPAFLADIPQVMNTAHQRTVFYEMIGQLNLGPRPNVSGQGGAQSQFWIDQAKYDPVCANQSVTIDVAEQWTLHNNSYNVAHPFHIHQNPFQLVSESDRGAYRYPVWRDVLAIPKATKPANAGSGVRAAEPNSDPDKPGEAWGKAVVNYVAKEFTGGFVHHCHILGHEDRGMMQNTQAVCANGSGATTGPVAPGTQCDANGFCPSDCATGTPVAAAPACPAPPNQQSDWPKAFGYTPSVTGTAAQPAPKPGSGGGGGRGGRGGGSRQDRQ